MIDLRHVSYRYPDSEDPVLRDLSLYVEEGEFLLVIGTSGAGKSTLLRCINGLVPHFYGGVFQGEVEVAGRDPVATSPRRMSDVVGFVFQDPEAQFVVDKVEEELAFSMENHNLPQSLMRKRVEEVLDQLNIAPLRQRRISTLSGGEKQRVAIGAVLTLEPKVVVLDEPTSQLDPQAAEEVLTTLQKLNADLGLTIILSEHRLERVVQYADRVLYLPGGGGPPTIGRPREVLKQVELVPPLVHLARVLDWQPLPLTIKEGRSFSRQIRVPGATPLKHSPEPAHDQSHVIDIRDLWFSYDGQEALRGAELTVGHGEFLALMGRNGSGKTTLLKHIVGLLHPQQGQIKLWGQDARGMTTDAIVRRIGYVPQNPNALLFADSLREELDFTRQSHRLPLGGHAELLRALGMEEHLDAYPRDLSAGERQRAALAAILVADPEVILLDEPTRGLDYRQKHSLADFLMGLHDEGKTVIVATHDVELVAHCADRVVIMGEGQVVVDGPARDVMTDSLVFSSQISKLFRDDRFLTAEEVLEAMGR